MDVLFAHLNNCRMSLRVASNGTFFTRSFAVVSLTPLTADAFEPSLTVPALSAPRCANEMASLWPSRTCSRRA